MSDATIVSKELVIERKEDRLWLTSPYMPSLPPQAKAIGGRWNPDTKQWHFPLAAEVSLRVMVKELFGKELPAFPPGSKVSVAATVMVTESYRGSTKRKRKGPVEMTAMGRATMFAKDLAVLVASLSDEEKEAIYDIIFNPKDEIEI